MRVYICHDPNNIPQAQELAMLLDKTLDAQSTIDIEVFEDENRWWQSVLEKILQCDIFVYLLTEQSLQWRPCKIQTAYAIDLAKTMLLVKLEPIPDMLIPDDFIDLPTIENFDSRSNSAVFKAVMNSQLSPPLPDPLPTAPRLPLIPVGSVYIPTVQTTHYIEELLAGAMMRLQLGGADDQDVERALEKLAEALQIDPTHPSTHEALRRIAQRGPQFARKVQELVAQYDIAGFSNSPNIPSPSGSSHDIFVSYAREDIGAMNQLVDDLRAQGFMVWTDSALDRGSRSFAREIKNAIGQAKVVVVLCSPDSEQSEWVENEIAMAQAYDKLIFPVWLKGSAIDAIPARLITYQRYDIRTDYQTGVTKLIDGIRANLTH
ncbi:MAG: toll/interleukin-1 receptor domain-containing protein [Anaerolineae bacterium]|nr:toll/interleukin-1 receptor domain-containing protein [Anaerolineae bacterium]